MNITTAASSQPIASQNPARTSQMMLRRTRKRVPEPPTPL
jgi:hypothetical protein